MSLKAKFAAMSLKAKVAVICAAAAVIGTAAVIVGVALNKEDSYRVLKVFEMAGSSVVNRESSGDLDAYVGMNLENGDILTVGEESNLRLSLDNDKYILLDEGTVMKLNAEGNSADSRTTLELRQGTILSEITKPLSADSIYEVATPKATMAVRGTSFSISVKKDENGGYIIIVNTFQGKVEVWLLDKDGNPTGQKAFVTADKCISIYTEPDADTGNPAEIDGSSRFVYIDEDGNISDVPEGEGPVYDIIYKFISKNIKVNALRSNESNLMILADEIVRKLKNSVSDDSDKTVSETSAASETEVTSEAESEVTTKAESEVTSTAESENMTEAKSDAPEVTTVPDTESSEAASESVGTAHTSMTEASSDSTTLRDTAAAATSSVTETSSSSAAKTTAASDDIETEDKNPGTKPFVTLPNADNTFMTLPPVITYTERETSEATTTGFTFPNNGLMTQPTTTTFGTSYFEPIIIVSPTDTTVTTPEETTVTVPAETTVTTITEETTTTAVPEETTTTTVPEETTTTTPEETTTTTAEPESVIYTVSFMYNGELIGTREVEDGKTVSDMPSKDIPGHTFVKWVDGNGLVFDTSVVVTGDMTVNAVYSQKTFTVTFSNAPSTEYYFDAGETFAASGYTFPTAPAGSVWVYNNGGTVTEFTAATAVSGSMTITASEAFTVSFGRGNNADDVTLPASITGIWNGTLLQSLLDPAPPAKTGYTGKWLLLSEDGTTAEIDAGAVVDRNMTVTADYTPKSFTVTFSNDPDAEYYFDAGESFAVSGYTFPTAPASSVWVYDNGVTKTEFTADTVVSGDITVTALDLFTVSFASNLEGVTLPAQIENVWDGTLLLSLINDEPEPRTGYTVKWMLVNAAETDTVDIDTTTAVDRNMTVKAVYTPKTFTVKFVVDGIATEYYFDAGEKFAGSGYTFPTAPASSVWVYDNGVTKTEFTADTVVSGDITVTALDLFTVSFASNLEGVTLPAQIENVWDGTLLMSLISAEPESRTGYTVKWMLVNAAGTDTVDIDTTTAVDRDMTVKAVYTPKTFTVKFVVDGIATEYYFDAGEKFAGSGYTFPTAPTGSIWVYDNGVTKTEFTAETAVTDNITVNAVKLFTVSFASSLEGVTLPAQIENVWDGTLLMSLISAEPESRTGYTVKWMLVNAAGTDTVDIDTTAAVDRNMTVKAVYTPKAFTVTFSNDPDAEYYFDAGEKFAYTDYTFPTAPTGSVWVYENGGTKTVFTAQTAINSDIAVNAVNLFTVSFASNLEGVTLPAQIENVWDGTLLMSLISAEPESRTGYTVKWMLVNAAGTDTVDIETTTAVDRNMTVKAVYTPKAFTVTFSNDPDAEYYFDAGEKFADTDYTFPTAPTGSVWVYENGGTKTVFTAETAINSDITVTALETFTISFEKGSNADGITLPASITGVLKGDSLLSILNEIDPESVAKDGYTHKWLLQSEDGSGVLEIKDDTVVDRDMIVKAYYYQNGDYRLKDAFAASQIVEQGTYANGLTQITLPSTASTVTGKEFVGWSLVSGGGTGTVNYSNIISGGETITLTSDSEYVATTLEYRAIYRHKPTVTWVNGETSAVAKETTSDTYLCTDGISPEKFTVSTTDAPADVIKTGFRTEWHYGESSTLTADTEFSESVTFTSEFIREFYTLTFEGATTEIITVDVIEGGTTLTKAGKALPDSGSRKKWVIDGDDTGKEFTADIEIEDDLTLKLEDRIYVTYYAEFVDNNGVTQRQMLLEQEVEKGNTPEKPALPLSITHTDGSNTYKYALDNDMWQTQWNTIKTVPISGNKDYNVEYVDASDIYILTNAFIDDPIVEQGTYDSTTVINPRSDFADKTIDGTAVTFVGWGYVSSGGSVYLDYDPGDSITPSNDSPNAAKPLEYKAFYRKTNTITAYTVDSDGDKISDSDPRPVHITNDSYDPDELIAMRYYVNYGHLPDIEPPKGYDYDWYYLKDGVETKFDSDRDSFIEDVTFYYKTYFSHYVVTFVYENGSTETRNLYPDYGQTSLSSSDIPYTDKKWVIDGTDTELTSSTQITSHLTVKEVDVP